MQKSTSFTEKAAKKKKKNHISSPYPLVAPICFSLPTKKMFYFILMLKAAITESQLVTQQEKYSTLRSYRY